MSEVGELSQELFTFIEITWEIDRSYIIGHNATYDVTSQPFSFAGATWTLHLWPFGKDSDNWIDLGIQRLDSNIPLHLVFCKFFLKTLRGKEFEPLQQCFECNATSNFYYISYIERNTFISKERIVLRNGGFSIVCQMRTAKISGSEAFSQTEVVELVTSCNNVSQDAATFPDDKLLEDFKALFLAQEDCDVVFKVKGQEFSAHRTILRARSPVFASTFRSNMKEKSTGCIEIEDCDPSSFSDFLYFLYCGKIDNLTTENVFSLFTTADKYDVQSLRLLCLEFIKNNLSVDNFCETLTLALKHVEKELIANLTDFFRNHFQEIIVTVDWQSFISENPIQGNEILIKALVHKK